MHYNGRRASTSGQYLGIRNHVLLGQYQVAGTGTKPVLRELLIPRSLKAACRSVLPSTVGGDHEIISGPAHGTKVDRLGEGHPVRNPLSKKVPASVESETHEARPQETLVFEVDDVQSIRLGDKKVVPVDIRVTEALFLVREVDLIF